MRTWTDAAHLKLYRCSLKFGKVNFYSSDHRLFRTSLLASRLQGEMMREENADDGRPRREQTGTGGSASGRPVEKRGDGGRRRGFIGPRTST